MNRIKFNLLICIFIILVLLISGCKTTYKCADGSEQISPKDCKRQFICFDGTKVEDSKRCKYVEIKELDKAGAEKIATTYVNSYLSISKIPAKLINSFESMENQTKKFTVTLVIQDKQAPYETTLNIDGKTGTVECMKNCQYQK